MIHQGWISQMNGHGRSNGYRVHKRKCKLCTLFLAYSIYSTPSSHSTIKRPINNLPWLNNQTSYPQPWFASTYKTCSTVTSITPVCGQGLDIITEKKNIVQKDVDPWKSVLHSKFSRFCWTTKESTSVDIQSNPFILMPLSHSQWRIVPCPSLPWSLILTTNHVPNASQ